MATINQLRIERFAIFRELKRTLRDVDTATQAAERRIERVLSRKRDVPDQGDLLEVMNLVAAIADAAAAMAGTTEQAEQTFGRVV